MALPTAINPLNYIVDRQYKNDALIKNKLFSARLNKARNLYRKDLLAHYGCVNAIEFSDDGEFLISGGDDKRVLLWSVAGAIYDKGSPIVMKTTHGSNIFCLTFDSHNGTIFSGGNDDQVLIHEIYTRGLIAAVPHESPVYGISINPHNYNIFTTAGEDGRILMFDVRENLMQDFQVMAQQSSGFHSVMFNPTNPRYMVTANSVEGIGLWDCRKPKSQLIHYDSKCGKISGISACFDSCGKKVLALRRRLPPVMYATDCEQAVCQFYHPQYYNSCTMKTCCFAGINDEYVLSGSDDFNLYMWKVPTDGNEWGSSHVVLRGHRSIVNQVRYNVHNNFIASSGVEKMVKLWSVIPVGNWRGAILKEHTETCRPIYSHEDYVSLVGTNDRINHDYSDQSTNEDAKMMAFFDSLIQREIEGWDSESVVSSSVASDSDSEEMDCSKIISKIYRNGRHHSDEPRKYKANRITQLISKKKNHLAKLAHNKSTSYQQRKTNGVHKKRTRRSSLRDAQDTSTNSRCRPRKYVKRRHSHDHYDNTINNIPTTSSTGNHSFRIINENSQDVAAVDLDDSSVQQNNQIVLEENLTDILSTTNSSRDILIDVVDVSNEDSPVNYSCHFSDVAPIDSVEVDADNDEELLHVHHSSTDETVSSLNATASSSETPSCSSRPPSHEIIERDDNDHHILQKDEGLSVDSSCSSDNNNSDDDVDIRLMKFMQTPAKKRRAISISDSGCATSGPSSSASSCSTANNNNNNGRPHDFSNRNGRLTNHQTVLCSSFNNNNNNNGGAGNDDGSSDDEYQYEKFRKRVKRSRMNLRSKIGADSDSN